MDIMRHSSSCRFTLAVTRRNKNHSKCMHAELHVVTHRWTASEDQLARHDVGDEANKLYCLNDLQL